ncbi:DUF3911 family protein [Bacillus sp. 165]|uniref:DUF3911 family protein n=1 Tax=Bacillus sp. 165 TaxID=1529117 RepID=UPI001ADD481D|nr:DUF3911 family protein [Bacillus sp. 165]MBO9128363.1 DUF3911 family protein [Bacillus sp. 165]
MASLQIKGSKEEVMEMLKLFDLMDTKGFCKLESYVELYPYSESEQEDYRSLFMASIDVHSNNAEIKDVLNDYLVSQMLTGVYND